LKGAGKPALFYVSLGLWLKISFKNYIDNQLVAAVLKIFLMKFLVQSLVKFTFAVPKLPGVRAGLYQQTETYTTR